MTGRVCVGGVIGAGRGKLLQGDAQRAQRHGVVHVQSEEPVSVRPHGGHQSHAVSGGQVRRPPTPSPPSVGYTHTHAQVRRFQGQRWAETGCCCALGLSVRSFSSTGPPWRSLYTHDWCGNQTWAQGNGGDCFSWCSIMDHYMNEVRPPTRNLPGLKVCDGSRCRRSPHPQTSSRHLKRAP